MMDPKFPGKPISAQFSSRTDLDQMPDTPNRGSHHRRAQSETFFRFSDDILLDDAVPDFDLSALDLPMTPAAAESDSSTAAADHHPHPKSAGPISHFRSLSVDADFFDGLVISDAGGGDAEGFGGKATAEADRPRYHHRHSSSMDGSSATSFDLDMMDNTKKALGPEKLAELSLIDPKRAKRFSISSKYVPNFM